MIEITHVEKANSFGEIKIGDRVSIPLKTLKLPKNGLFMGECLLRSGLSFETGLEIGTGQYAPASFCFLASSDQIKIDGTEIDRGDIDALNKVIELNNLSDRFIVYSGSLYEPIKSKKYDVIFSNIAQLPKKPDQENIAHDHGGDDGWLFMSEIISEAPNHLNKNGYLALMAFDFLGIEERTNPEIPCLLERLNDSNFEIITIENYSVPMRPNGQTADSLSYIASTFPDAKFQDTEGISVKISDLFSTPLVTNFKFILARLQ
jgi:hypothetical protein